jgi:hypothetical protein
MKLLINTLDSFPFAFNQQMRNLMDDFEEAAVEAPAINDDNDDINLVDLSGILEERDESDLGPPVTYPFTPVSTPESTPVSTPASTTASTSVSENLGSNDSDRDQSDDSDRTQTDDTSEYSSSDSDAPHTTTEIQSVTPGYKLVTNAVSQGELSSVQVVRYDSNRDQNLKMYKLFKHVMDSLIAEISPKFIKSLAKDVIQAELWVLYANKMGFSNSVFPLYQSYSTLYGFPSLGTYPTYNQDTRTNYFKSLMAVPMNIFDESTADKMNKIIVGLQDLKLMWFASGSLHKTWFYTDETEAINHKLYDYFKRTGYGLTPGFGSEHEIANAQMTRMFMRQLQRHIVLVQIQLSPVGDESLPYMRASCVQEGQMLFFDGYFTIDDDEIGSEIKGSYKSFQKYQFLDFSYKFYDPTDGILYDNQKPNLVSSVIRELELFYILLSSIQFGDFVKLIENFLYCYLVHGGVVMEICRNFVKRSKTTPVENHPSDICFEGVERARKYYSNVLKSIKSENKRWERYNFSDTPVVAPVLEKDTDVDTDGTAKLYTTEIFFGTGEYPPRRMSGRIIYSTAKVMLKNNIKDIGDASKYYNNDYYLYQFVLNTLNSFNNINDRDTFGLSSTFEDDEYISYLLGLTNFSTDNIDNYIHDKMVAASQILKSESGSIYFKTMEFVVEDINDVFYMMCLSPSTYGFVKLRKLTLAFMRLQLKTCLAILNASYDYTMSPNEVELPIPSKINIKYMPLYTSYETVKLKLDKGDVHTHINWDKIDNGLFVEMLSQSLFYYVKVASQSLLDKKEVPSQIINELPKTFNMTITSDDIKIFRRRNMKPKIDNLKVSIEEWEKNLDSVLVIREESQLEEDTYNIDHTNIKYMSEKDGLCQAPILSFLRMRFEKGLHSFEDEKRSYDTDNPYKHFMRDTFYGSGDDSTHPPPVPSYTGDPPDTVFPVIDESKFLAKAGFDKSASTISPSEQLPIGETVDHVKATKPSVEEIKQMIPRDVESSNIVENEINEDAFVDDSCSEGFREDISDDLLESEIYVTVYDDTYVPSPARPAPVDTGRSSLPYGGSLQLAMSKQDRDAIRKIMAYNSAHPTVVSSAVASPPKRRALKDETGLNRIEYNPTISILINGKQKCIRRNDILKSTESFGNVFTRWMFNLPECNNHSYADIKTRLACPDCVRQLEAKIGRIAKEYTKKDKDLANEMQNGQYFGPETSLPLYRRIDLKGHKIYIPEKNYVEWKKSTSEKTYTDMDTDIVRRFIAIPLNNGTRVRLGELYGDALNEVSGVHGAYPGEIIYDLEPLAKYLSNAGKRKSDQMEEDEYDYDSYSHYNSQRDEWEKPRVHEEEEGGAYRDMDVDMGEGADRDMGDRDGEPREDLWGSGVAFWF